MSSAESWDSTPAAKLRFLRFAAGVLLCAFVAGGAWALLRARATTAELRELEAELQAEGLLLESSPARALEGDSTGGTLTWLAEAQAQTSPTWDRAELAELSYDELLSAARAEAASLGLAADALEDERCGPPLLEAWLRATLELTAAVPARDSSCAEELLALLLRFDAGGLEHARRAASQRPLRREDLPSPGGEGLPMDVPQIPVFELRPVLERLALAARLEAAAGETEACVADLEAGFAVSALTVELDWWLGAVLWMSSEDLMLTTLREVLPELEGCDLSALEARIERHDPLLVARAALLGEAALVQDLFRELKAGEREVEEVSEAGSGLLWFQRWFLESDHLSYLRGLRAQLQDLERPSGPRAAREPWSRSPASGSPRPSRSTGRASGRRRSSWP